MGNSISSTSCAKGWPFGDDVKAKHRGIMAEQPGIEEKLTPDDYLNTLFCSAVLSDVLYSTKTSNINENKAILEGLARSYPFFQPKTAHFSPRQDILFCELDTMLVVAFRGAVSMDDWVKTNLNVGRKVSERLRGFEVHGGFFDLSDEVPLDAAWALASRSKKRLVFTGHSKGGAVAELCARMACLENSAKPLPGGKIVSCITFGQPHVAGSHDFPSASAIRLILHRFVFGDDMVPFSLSSLNFHPTGCFLCIKTTDGGERSVKLDQCDINERHEMRLRLALSDLSFSAISNHRMNRYRRELLRDAEFNIQNDVICRVETSLVPWPLDQKDPFIEAAWKGMEDNTVCVSIKLENVDSDELWKYNLTKAVLSLRTRPVRGGNNGDDSVKGTNITKKPLSPELISGYTRPDLNIYHYDALITVEFKIPNGYVPDDGSYQLKLYHTMHQRHYSLTGSLSLRTVWFIGDTGAGKTHLIKCLNILAKHGNKSEMYLNRQEEQATAAPADNEATFRACGIFFRELLGARFHDIHDSDYILKQMLNCPPRLVVCVANSQTKHPSDEKTRRGLKYVAEELRAFMRNSANESGVNQSVGICWAFTQWAKVPINHRKGKFEDMKAVLGVSKDDQVFKINSGVTDLGHGPLPICGVEELFNHIRKIIPHRNEVEVDWKWARTMQILARELLNNHGGKITAATLGALGLLSSRYP